MSQGLRELEMIEEYPYPYIRNSGRDLIHHMAILTVIA
jgi:hypothetical protein